jgi:hypothetical protein
MWYWNNNAIDMDYAMFIGCRIGCGFALLFLFFLQINDKIPQKSH